MWVRLKIPLAAFFFSLIAGTVGFWLLEDNVDTIFNSFFFTLDTVTTVGYGDVTPQTVAGKVLAIGVIIAGVGAALVSMQTVFESLVGRRIKEELKMPEREVRKTGHYIICGYSMVGKAIVRNLMEKKADFVVVEQDKEKVRKMVEDDLTVIEGDAREETVLERAGIRNARCLFVTMDDSYNVFVTLTAKLLNPSLHIVAKTENSYNIAKLKKAGADEVVACHDAGARMMVDKAE